MTWRRCTGSESSGVDWNTDKCCMLLDRMDDWDLRVDNIVHRRNAYYAVLYKLMILRSCLTGLSFL
jgi:hypothetical protein